MNTKFLKMKNLFTKNYWAMKGFALLVLVVMGGSVRGQVTIVSDGLNSSTTLFTLSSGAYYNSSSSSSDRPASRPFYVEGSASRGIINGSATLTSSADINTNGYTNILLSFRLAAFAITSTTNGLDGPDIITVEVSPNSGTTWYSTARVLGNSNCYWDYSATGLATTPYDENITPVDFTPAGGGSRTTDGYSTINVSSLPATTTLRIRITMLNNDVKEQWVVDDFKITGTAAATPSIAISNGSIAAGSPNNGQTNVVLQRYDMAVTTANANLTGLTVITAGTYAAADLTNLKCWYQSSSTFNSGTATLLSTKTTSLSPGSQVFPSFTSQSITSGNTGYIFVTADIASGATNGNTINIATTDFSNISFASGTKTGTDPVAAAGTQTITVATNNWTGAISTSWNNTGNWSLGTVPLSTDNITISSGNPVMDVDFTLASGRTLTISGTGTLTINPTRTLTIAGTADFGDKAVTLKSDNTGTAAIGQITGTLSNATNLTVERYIPALRKFRFLAAPVVGATAANWRNNGTNTAGIGTHITGGVGNNFDQSTTNAASAFWYNEVNAGSDVTVGSGATSDPGWTAFANGNTEALTNGKGFRILVRGDRTISLDGTGSVTPTNTTLSVTGTYPGASVSIATTKTNSNTNSGYNLVGNPYPATIDWNTVTKGADISATYTIYDPTSNSYKSWNGTSGLASQYIASGQAFFVQQTGATGGITIAEANKATNAAGNYFRNKLTDHLKVSMTYDSANYDAAFIHFRADAQNDFDNYDGLKFQNTGVNIASVGTDSKRYNINSLASLTKTTEMPLSVLGSVLTNFELKFEDVESFKNHELYLIDNYLNKMLLMSNGFTYPIALSTDSASVKDGRFKIVFVQKATGINLNEKNANAFILYPNPAADAIHLLLDAKNTTNENVAFEICNQLGAIIQFGNLDFTTTKDQSINIETLAQGIYFIKLQSNAQQQIIKFIK